MSTYKKIKDYYLAFVTRCYQFANQEVAVTTVEYAVVAAAIVAITMVLTGEDGGIYQLFSNVFDTSSNKVTRLVSGRLEE